MINGKISLNEIVLQHLNVVNVKIINSKMEEELEFYSNGYRELSAEVNELRGAILLLKRKHNIQDEIIDGLLLKPTTVPTNVTSIPSTIPTTLNPT